jgi:hypothetical protein
MTFKAAHFAKKCTNLKSFSAKIKTNFFKPIFGLWFWPEVFFWFFDDRQNFGKTLSCTGHSRINSILQVLLSNLWLLFTMFPTRWRIFFFHRRLFTLYKTGSAVQTIGTGWWGERSI